MQKLITAMGFAGVLTLAGCSGFPGVYKYPVEQGNPLTETQISQLEVGMSEGQVLFLLGSPALVNRLENGRWIYVFEKFVGDEVIEQSKLEVIFEDGVVSELKR